MKVGKSTEPDSVYLLCLLLEDAAAPALPTESRKTGMLEKQSLLCKSLALAVGFGIYTAFMGVFSFNSLG